MKMCNYKIIYNLQSEEMLRNIKQNQPLVRLASSKLLGSRMIWKFRTGSGIGNSCLEIRQALSTMHCDSARWLVVNVMLQPIVSIDSYTSTRNRPANKHPYYKQPESPQSRSVLSGYPSPCPASPCVQALQGQASLLRWVEMRVSAYFGKRLHGMLSWTHVHV